MKVDYSNSLKKVGSYTDEATNVKYDIEANIEQYEDNATLQRLQVKVSKDNSYIGYVLLENGSQSMNLPYDSDIVAYLTMFNEILEDLKAPKTEEKK